MGTCVIQSLRKLLLFLLLIALNVFAEPKKVVIFYSSIGMGHISAAKAIKQNLEAKDSTVVVELKNIRDFMPKWKADLDEWLFWKIVKNAPDTFDKMFKSKMESQSKRFDFVESLGGQYNQKQIIEYLNKEKPTHILSTHYGSTEAMIKVRKEGSFNDVPVGWLHTDYFKGYFPRISQNIDMTFLGIDALAAEWAKHGLDESKVAVTGLPINTMIFEPLDRVAFMKEQGLNPSIKTIVLMSGGEGIGDFPAIVKSVASKFSEPIQFVAICGKNAEHFKNLNALVPTLPPNFNLRVLGFTKNEIAMNYVKSSDLYITKTGGLSPTEGFAINKPVVLLEVYGGHERENAKLFEEVGLGVVNHDERTIGRDVFDLLNNPVKKAEMAEKHLAFIAKYNLGKITDFVLKEKENKEDTSKQFGVENGRAVKNFEKALESLDKDFPADVEIILSYGKSKEGHRFKGDTNPFGHVAMKIDGVVYTLNGRAKFGVEKELVHKTNLAQYMYGVERFVTNMEHTDAFGNSYGRDNISIKVAGVTQAEKDRMLAYIAEVDAKFLEGKAGYHKKEFNCADLIKKIFESAGFVIPKHKGPTLPLDVLSDLKTKFEADARFKTEMIHYAHVPNSENVYQPLRFPLSPRRGVIQTTRTLIKPETLDPFERLIGKRVAVGMDKNVYYDNVSGVSQQENDKAMDQSQLKLTSYLKFFENYERQLDALESHMKQYKFDSEELQKDLKIISKEYTVDELSNVIQNRIDESTFPNAEKREKAVKLQIGFNEWDRLQSKYQAKMDIFIQREMDYLIIGTQTMIKVLLDDLKLRFPNTDLKTTIADFTHAEVAYKKYMKHREQIGTAFDGPNRTLPFREYFGFAKGVIDSYDKMTGKPFTEQVEVVTWKSKAKRLFSFTSGLVKLTPQMINLAFNVFSKDRSSEGKTPLSTSISDMFRGLSKSFNVKTDIQGLEHLTNVIKANPVGTKTVNIIAPNHSHPIYDAILMSAMGLPHHLLVMATDQIVPKNIADRMDANSSIVTVGRGSDLPINKIIAELERGISNNIMIYPEGSISSGIYDTRPAREKFSHGLIKKLVEMGYKVNIVPVTYKNASRFLNENSIAEFFKKAGSVGPNSVGTVLEASVNPAIPPEIVESIIKSGKYHLLNTYLRQHWLEELGTIPKTISGLLRSDELISKFNEQFKVNLKNLKVNTNKCYRFYN